MFEITQVTSSDFERIWPIIKSVAERGDTYTYDINLDQNDAKSFWLDSPRQTYMVTEGSDVLGIYYLKTNQLGGGNHVCNCAYMVSTKARGKGIATLMCQHSQEVALQLGYKAMQFNFVVSTNKGAIRLWEKLGFDKVGRLPRAFNHPKDGYVDALVMYKWLAD